MKKIHLPGIHLNPSRWGKSLLAIGLLLVFVQGLSQLYEVQNFFFPGRYPELKLRLIEEECLKVKKGLQAFGAKIDELKALREDRARLQTGLPDCALSSSPPYQPGHHVGFSSELPWQSTLQAAKKARVYVARKLPLIDTQLRFLHRSLELQGAETGAASPSKKPEIHQTFQRVQEHRACWRAYNDKLDDLSDQLKELVRETHANK